MHILSSNEKPTRPTPSTTLTSQPTPINVRIESTPKPVEPIPKFYFPNGKVTVTSTNETVIMKHLRQAKDELFIPKHDKLHLEDFGKLAQVC